MTGLERRNAEHSVREAGIRIRREIRSMRDFAEHTGDPSGVGRAVGKVAGRRMGNLYLLC